MLPELPSALFVRRAFELLEFFRTGHEYRKHISHRTKQVCKHITERADWPWPDESRPGSRDQSQESNRRSRSPSNTPIYHWPQQWAIDKSVFRKDLQSFEFNTLYILRYIETTPSTSDITEAEASGTASDSAAGTAVTASGKEATTSHTSADEEIHRDHIPERSEQPRDRPEGPANPSQSTELPADMSSIEAQLAELRAMIAAIQPLRGEQGPQGEQGPPGDRGETGPSGTSSGGDRPDRFNPDDVGYFDPFYEGKSVDTGPAIEHTGKSTFFRDIHVFLDRVKDVARAKGDTLLRQNLQLCLRGSALAWFTTELSEEGKRLVTYDIEEWYKLLLKRWKAPRAQGMTTVLREKYTLQDAARHREPREYAQLILRAAQNAELGTLKDHMLLIWNGLDMEFQRDIPEPDAKTDYNRFLESLDYRKYQWWEHASRHSRQQQQPRRQDNRADSSRGYQFRPSQSYQPQSSQRFQPQYNAYQSQYQPQSQFQPQSRPWKPTTYGNQAYPSNQYSGNQGNAQASLPAPPTRLQIMPPPGNANASGSRPADRPSQDKRPSRPAGNYQNQDRRNAGKYPDRRFPPRQQRAYQAGIEEGNSDQLPEGQDVTDQEAYSGHAPYESEEGSAEGFSSHPYDEHSQDGYDQEDHEDLYADGYFTKVVPTADFQCENCQHKTTSRNKLFVHLRDECWKRKPSAEASNLYTDAFADTAKLPATAGIATPAEPLIIPSVSEPVPGTGFAFRNYHYAVTHISWEPAGDKKESCADPGCTMTMADRTFVPPTTELKKMATKIPIRGLGTKIHHSDEYAVLTFFMEGVLPDGTRAFARITREIHIVDDLKAGMLIGADILTPERMVIDFATQSIKIGSCRDMTVPMDSRARSEPIKRTVKSSTRMVLPPRATTQVPVAYSGKLPEDRDLLFEPQCSLLLGHSGGVFAHIVDASFRTVHVKNDTDQAVIIPRKARLGILGEYQQDGCLPIGAHHANLAATGWRNWKTELARKAFAVAVAMSAAVTSDGLTKPSSDTTSMGSLGSFSPGVAGSANSGSTAIAIDPHLEHVMPNGVTIYGKPDAAEQLAQLLDQHQDLFIDKGQTVDIPESEWMPIPLKPNVTSKPSKVYPVGRPDKEVINATFDKMHEQGKMSWSTQPTPFSYPVFVVWKDTPNGRKGRVVVDIRELNKITEVDSYPLPLQSEIIALLLGYMYLSILDAVGWFHQFLVVRRDRYKFTVVSHRGQEESAVALMGYKGSPPYVQRQTDAMLRPFKDFAKAYVDDIIVFSHTLQEHLSHLNQIFQLFRAKRVSLSPTKSFIGYPSVTLLGQKVDGLGMSTSQEKIQAITDLRFPETLRDLEIFLGLTGWLRSSIPRYAQTAAPLQERKTVLTKGLGSGIKGPARKRSATRVVFYAPTEAELTSFRRLQQAFASPTFLAHYDSTRPLFIDIDASKSFGFAAMVYHHKNDQIAEKLVRTDVQPILFLSRCLNAAERNYWPTELEISAIVWVVKKTRHMIESNQKPPVIVYTDHSAAIPISKQTTLNTTSTDKLNLRLIRASQYLSAFNLELRHKAGKSNTVPDALSRLPQATKATSQASDQSEGALDALYGNVEPQEVSPTMTSETSTSFPGMASSGIVGIYHTTLVEMSDDFKERLKQGYHEDVHWERLLGMLKPSAEATNSEAESATPERRIPGIPFALREGLIYHINGENRRRLCIPPSMEQELFEQVHDLSNHGGYHRCHDRLSHTVFIRHLSRNLRTYIAHCPACQVNQTKRHKPYGSLVPISTPAIPFHTIAMDFVGGLPSTISGMNALLTITCKFTKKVLLLSGKDTWTAAQWAEIVLRNLLQHDWGIPRSIISDRDTRFMSAFWKEIFGRMNVKFLTSTAYHPQTDGQSERTNQSVEIALRFHITARPDNDWDEILPYVQATMNNSPSSVTGLAPNELCYGFRVNDTTNMLLAAPTIPAEAYHELRLAKREEAEDAMAFASISMKARYDAKHLAFNVGKGDRVFLKLHSGYSIPGVSNKKLSQQRVGPFKVIERVGQLAYRLELPPLMKIHPVISVAQLEPALSADPYHRQWNPEPPPVTDQEPEKPGKPYELERLLEKKTMYGKPHYLVKWKDYGNEHNAWYSIDDLPNATNLIRDYEQKHLSQKPTRLLKASVTRAPKLLKASATQALTTTLPTPIAKEATVAVRQAPTSQKAIAVRIPPPRRLVDQAESS